jgi:DNA-directed RNA polymerase specialized sigma24 family protein
METNDTSKVIFLNGRTPAGLTVARRLPDTPLRVVGTGDARRDAILSDANVLDSIRSVIRGRGVPEVDVDDILHDVIEGACEDQGLPLNDKEHARLYLCGCARYKSIDDARARKKQRMHYGKTDVDGLASPDLPADQRVLAHELDRQGQKAFPFTYPWFQRFAIGGETHAEIAADPRVTSGHVANEVANIRRALRAFALAGFALLLGALGLHLWRPGSPPGGAPIAHSGVPAQKSPPVPSALPRDPAPPAEAMALRDRAAHECGEGHWEECLVYLNEAWKLDPRGESPELLAMRRRAQDALESFEAKPRR